MILTGKNRLPQNFFPVLNIRSFNIRDTINDGSNFENSNNCIFTVQISNTTNKVLRFSIQIKN